MPAVIALLKDENMLARHAALEALGAIPDPKGAAAAAESPRGGAMTMSQYETLGA